MKKSVLMRVMNCVLQIRHEFPRAPDRHRRVLDCVVELPAFDKLHAEVTGTIQLTHFVNRNDARIFQAGGRFRFPAKAFQMRFSSPGAQTDHFERDGAIKTLLIGAINYALTTASNFLQQRVFSEVCQHSDRLRGFLPVRCSNAFGVARVRAPGYRFVIEQTEAALQKTGRANFLCCVAGDFCSARSANGDGSLHADGQTIDGLMEYYGKFLPLVYVRSTTIK